MVWRREATQALKRSMSGPSFTRNKFLFSPSPPIYSIPVIERYPKSRKQYHSSEKATPDDNN
jgi:hypothetical protein